MKDDEYKKLFVSVKAHQHRKRIDQILAEEFPEFSRAFFQKHISQGALLVNGQVVDNAAKRLQENDQLSFSYKPETVTEPQKEAIPLDILLEDEHIIVLNKQAGLVVHPGNANEKGTLVNALLHYNEKTFSALLDEDKRPGIVHRLDKNTSGIIIVAKTKEVENLLKQSFKDRNMQKKYLALCVGTLDKKEGSINSPLGRNPKQRHKMAVLKSGGKEALSHYKVLQEKNGCSLIEVEIITGRTHQIRVHLASVGCPIIGDSIYGGRKLKKAEIKADRQMLHAWKLQFEHPISKEIIKCQAKPPEDFQNVMESCGFAEL